MDRFLGWIANASAGDGSFGRRRCAAQPDSVYFSFPKLRWSVCHLRELLPTAQISRGLGAPVPLEYLPAEELATMQDAIDKLSFTVVYERYFGCLQEDGKHAAMSMTKSITGLLAQILVVEGKLNDSAMVSEYVPELGDSAFANATPREVMDMTTGVKYREDYADPNADIRRYSAAASPFPKPQGYSGPDGYWAYLQQVKPEGDHGVRFHYKTINSDLLGWIVSRVSGKSVAKLASERLWRRIGAEQDAYQTVDAKGVPFAGGGVTAGLRDLGRIGLLMLHEGQFNGKRLFPAEVVQQVRAGGDESKFVGFPTIPGGSYPSQWWVFHNSHGAFAARGVHGQTISS